MIQVRQFFQSLQDVVKSSIQEFTSLYMQNIISIKNIMKKNMILIEEQQQKLELQATEMDEQRNEIEQINIWMYSGQHPLNQNSFLNKSWMDFLQVLCVLLNIPFLVEDKSLKNFEQSYTSIQNSIKKCYFRFTSLSNKS